MATWFKILGWIIGILAAIVGILYAFFFDVWVVPSDDPLLSASIEPTLSAGDVIVFTRRTDVTRGNLLRCPDPQAPGRFVVARAIGAYGDHLEIAGEVVSIDGHRNPSPRACAQRVLVDPQTNEEETLTCSVEDYGAMTYEALRGTDHLEPPTRSTVEAGKWFLVSDDRHIHLDSRDFGEVPVTDCKHIVFRIESAKGLGDDAKRLSVIW
jgi:signal peptidase I